MYRDHRIGVVIPAYKEEQLIGATLEGIPEYIDTIYVIDDGSPDRTGAIAQEHAQKDSRIVYLRHARNSGVGAAIRTGYNRSSEDQMDISVVMAGDNQMDPHFLPSLLDPIIDEGIDYSKGNRLYNKESRKGMSAWRTFGNFVLTYLTKLASGYWFLVDPQNGYTALSRHVSATTTFDFLYPGYGYCNVLLAWLNINDFTVKDVPIPARYGNETSGIRYHSYIPRLTSLLLRCFGWRINNKYLKSGHLTIGLCYILGIAFLFAGFSLFAIEAIGILLVGMPWYFLWLVSFAIGMMGALFFISGVALEIKTYHAQIQQNAGQV
jgi:glycosyltransferase involved in cell wall biosynthesis